MRYIFFFVFISSSLLIYQIIKIIFVKDRYIDRLDKYTKPVDIKKEIKSHEKYKYRKGLRFIAKGFENVGALDNYKLRIRKKLNRANVLLRPEEFIAISIMTFFTTVIFVAIGTGSIFIGVLVGIIGWMIPSIFINSKINSRVKIINNQLGDTINVISNSLKAGHSFFQAIDSVSKEMKGPIAEEFSKLQKEISLGVTTEKALETMVERVKSDDLELMVTAVLIQRQIGGNLAEILDNISKTIRQRVTIKGEIKTLTAQGRLSGWIIALLPVVLTVALFVMNPDHIIVLFKEPLGILMIAQAIFMELIGVYMVRKVVNIEV